MADSLKGLNLKSIKTDCISASNECNQRGLTQSAKWFIELAASLDTEDSEQPISLPQDEPQFLAEHVRYTQAKIYFDLKEYDRAAFFVQNSSHPKVYFLHMYSRYMSGEKKKLDNATDSTGVEDELGDEYLRTLRLQLHRKNKNNDLDAYALYLYGVVLRKLDLREEALDAFVASIQQEPLCWASWLELTYLITDKDMLAGLSLPNHWLRNFFLAHTHLELQLNEEALRLYTALSEAGFERCTYVMAQTAVAYHNVRDVDVAVQWFSRLQKIDPYRLDNLDTYSNLLYIKEMRAELAHLAHHCCDIDKYRVETCCIIGNYYSLRMQHEKAILYFQRALKLNPNFLSAWTLMGHEYVEVKNTSAAIQAYRQAIEVNQRDYRAWYGLGQIYEILKMPFYCLYYYRKAQMLKPEDSRMVVALGETYEKLDRLQEAKKCFWKAHSIGDIEGMALIKLAKLYERLNEEEQAVAAYTEYINELEAQGTENFEELYAAYRYLANYHLAHKNLEDAYAAAQKCTEFNETREEGKALLKMISRMRASTSSVQMDVGGDFDDFSATGQSRLPAMTLNFT